MEVFNIWFSTEACSPLSLLVLSFLHLSQHLSHFSSHLSQVNLPKHDSFYIMRFSPSTGASLWQDTSEKSQSPEWTYLGDMSQGWTQGQFFLLSDLYFMEAVPDVFWKYS